jgi:hypothetical protein
VRTIICCFCEAEGQRKPIGFAPGARAGDRRDLPGLCAEHSTLVVQQVRGQAWGWLRQLGMVGRDRPAARRPRRLVGSRPETATFTQQDLVAR